MELTIFSCTLGRHSSSPTARIGFLHNNGGILSSSENMSIIIVGYFRFKSIGSYGSARRQCSSHCSNLLALLQISVTEYFFVTISSET